MSNEENRLLSEIDQEVNNELQNAEEVEQIDPEREAKRKARAEALQIAVENGNTDSLIRKVAYVLNRYPDTRNSDIALQIQFWKEFHNIHGDTISINKLFDLERLTSITRSRQKIQNEYNLYQADAPVRKWRSDQVEKEREKQIINKPSMPVLYIYADETGKNEKYLIIGSIWILDDRVHGEMTTQLIRWIRDNSELDNFPKEFHFKNLDNRGNDIHHYKDFFNLVLANSDMISFKAIAVNKHNLNRISLSEIIRSLYSQLVKVGIEHELSTGRITPPKQVRYIKDKEDGESSFELSQIRDTIQEGFHARYENSIKLNDFASLPSESIKMIQIADLFTASLNRVYNYQPGNVNRNAKDELAKYLIDTIELNEIKYDAERFNQNIEVDFNTDMSTIFVFE